MVKDNIITCVVEPTDWWAPVEVVSKNGAIRLCVDYTQLYKYVDRGRFLPSVDKSSLNRLGNSFFVRENGLTAKLVLANALITSKQHSLPYLSFLLADIILTTFHLEYSRALSDEDIWDEFQMKH